MKFVVVPPGQFPMGSPETEADRGADETQHRVEITRPFYLGVYQVTQEEYQKVMGTNPSNFKHDKRLPVDQVSWEEAVEFCRKLSGLAEERKRGRSYRLPTEAEWEYSCREGGLSLTPFHYGTSLSSTQANFNGQHPYGGAPAGNYLQKTTPVGSYKPNKLGLFDMHGNVFEWCSDWYDENYYNSSPRQDPRGPQNGNHRVLRGGAWGGWGQGCRAAFRVFCGPNDPNRIGFRVVLVIGAGAL
jgi:formylglycine-generating enzyme required for sulfatase activity